MVDDKPEIPEQYPADEWTPKQKENFENHGQAVYEAIDSKIGRYWYRRTYRPKKRNNGMMTRDHVKIGTPEDWLDEHIEDVFDPWGSMMGLMMRKLGSFDVDKDELEQAKDEIVSAKLEVLKEQDPQRALRLLRETENVAELYGVGADEEVDA